MARKPPEMNVNLGGFESIYPVGSPPETIPDPSAPAKAAETPVESPLPARSPSGGRKPAKQGREAGKTTPAPKAKWGEGRTRNTRSFSITDDLFERLRRAAYAEGVTMSEIIEKGGSNIIDALEERRGGPYPAVPEVRSSGVLDDL